MQSAKHESTPANDPWTFVHPLTSEDDDAMAALRWAVAGMKGKLEGISGRAPLNSIIEGSKPRKAILLRRTPSEGFPAGGPSRRGPAKEGQSFTCTAAGSIGEQPKHSATWRATSP